MGEVDKSIKIKRISFIILMFFVCFYVIKTKFLLGGTVAGIYAVFFLISIFKKNSVESIIDISCSYSKKSKIVLSVFMFVGALTASWIASGTIPGIIYYGIKFINPSLFVFFTFLITSIVAVFLGSSFGTTSTIGVALMAIAKSGNIDINIVGAAIISGIYFGDRWSPLSSSANLVASLTEIDIYTNLKNMAKSMIVPYILTGILYIALSKNYVLDMGESTLPALILENYNLDTRFVFIPLASIIVFSLLRINVRISMAVSIVLASFVGFFTQKETFTDILNYLFFGFYKFNGTALEKIIKGGGVISMLNASALILISCSLIGIFEQLKILEYIKGKINNVKTRADIFKNTVIVSIITGMIGANQTIAVIMTEQIIEKVYDEKKIKRADLAKDIENSAIVIPGIIPWNIACYLPCTMLGISSFTFIPFAFYIWLMPICTYLAYKFFNKEKIGQEQ